MRQASAAGTACQALFSQPCHANSDGMEERRAGGPQDSTMAGVRPFALVSLVVFIN